MASYRLLLTAGLFLVVLNLLIAHQYFVLHNMSVVFEDSLVENLTAVFYIVAAVSLLLNARGRVGFERFLTLFFGITCLTLFLREVDVEDLAVPQILKLIGSGLGRNLLLTTAYLVLLIIFWRFYRSRFRCFTVLCTSPVATITLVGCLLLVCGAVCENLDNLFLEEMLEMNGALLILAGALLHQIHPQLLTNKMQKAAE